uniref:Uncharacterized protein n=1 Tax=Romanomermis culicivorax TaxID=13658 RepID=A0A915JZQ3_ROMCU
MELKLAKHESHQKLNDRIDLLTGKLDKVLLPNKYRSTLVTMEMRANELGRRPIVHVVGIVWWLMNW